MADGTALQLFNNYMEATGPSYPRKALDGVVNDAQIHRTYSWGALQGGDHGFKMMVRGGNEIRFASYFQTGQVTHWHHAGATQEYQQPQKAVHGRAAWRFLITHKAWTLQTIELHEGGGDDFDRFFNLRQHLNQMEQTDLCDFIESHVWSEPDFNEMESMTGGDEGKMYCIPAFINEYTNGLFNNSGTAGTQWTTIHGLDPTSSVKGQNRYVPQVVGYSNEITNTTNPTHLTTTILGAFNKMWKKVHWEKPPRVQEYFSDPAYSKQQIMTSEAGQTAYQLGLQAAQDLFVIAGRQDPAYPDPQFNFIPVKYVSALQTATLYPEGTTDAITNNAAENNTQLIYGGGPRYYWINSNYLHPVWHDTYYFREGPIMNHMNDPDSFVQISRTWGNMLCPSRMRQGLIRPNRVAGTDLYASLYT